MILFDTKLTEKEGCQAESSARNRYALKDFLYFKRENWVIIGIYGA